MIREHYLTGEPNGIWDNRTKQAMARYQQDNGWQTRTVPDSRALIKLGLGPDHATLINGESATATPPAPLNKTPDPSGATEPKKQ